MEIVLRTVGTLFFRGAGLVLGMLTGVLSARMLGPEGRGIYSFATLIASLYLTFFGGLSAAIAREISNLKRDQTVVLANGFVLSVASGLVVLLLGLGWRATPWAVGQNSTAVLLVVLIAPLALSQIVMQGTFLGTGLIYDLNYAALFSQGSLLVFLGALRLAGAVTPELVVSCWCAAQVITMGWTWWRVGKRWRPDLRTVDIQTLKRLGWFAAQIGFVNAISFLNYRVDAFLVKGYLGSAQLGIYSVALSLSEMVWQVSSSLSLVIYARVGSSSEGDAAKLIARTMRHLFVVVLGCAGFLALFGGWALRILYGQAYAPALPVIRLLLPGVTLYSLTSMIAVYFTNQIGRPALTLSMAGLSMAICLFGSVVLIPKFGLVGAALATSGSYGIVAVASFVIFGRLTGLRVSEMLFLNRSDIHGLLNPLGRWGRQAKSS